MRIEKLKYSLELKHQFTISHSSRSQTPVILVKVEQDGITGFGEASLPPYLKETQDSVVSFLNKIKLRNIFSIDDLTSITSEINSISNCDQAAKAAINIALYDLLGELTGKPVHEIIGINKNDRGFVTSFTIGIDNDESIREKINEANEYKILKIKLGTDHDKHIVNIIREETSKPLYVDANQGWEDKYFALDMIEWLKDKNVLIVEQPMPVDLIADSAWLKEKSALPIIADEAVQTFDDIVKIKNSYHGINIKLMKCGGIYEGYRMINHAKENGLKIMLGCMTETSCGISAAAQFAALADFIDLDGNLLITNDPFEKNSNKNGKIFMDNLPGLGIKEKQKLFL